MSAMKRRVAEESINGEYPSKKRKDLSVSDKPHGKTLDKSNSAPRNSTSTSKDAHAKQRALALERKAAKPHADSIQRAKKLWERLRLKSHVPLDERHQLVVELFDIVTGQVKDFVFKHDSVRVIQCALKYANVEQRKIIAGELRGNYRQLAESRYAKFLVGKILVQADAPLREQIIAEFYGGVKSLINHPEASWIVDDTYRGIATPEQKAVLLREWYGPEFALFRAAQASTADADLANILATNPEKRSSIMNHLHGMINQLVQKKMTGFTMLHDAMLQYFLNTTPGTEEANDFLELLKGDDEGDLLKNLAFTHSGARLVCYALAYGNAKDRKNLLKVYKDHIDALAFDAHGHLVLLAAYDLVDDTVMTAKLVFPELLGTKLEAESQQARILDMAHNLTARIPLLYPFAVDSTPGSTAKWLIAAQSPTAKLIQSLHEIRAQTSKKDPEVRRRELVKAASAPPLLLETIAARAADLIRSSFGCQFIAEVLLDSEGDKAEAVAAVAAAASGDPTPKDSKSTTRETTVEGEGASAEDVHPASSAAAARLLKTLALGGRYNMQTRQIVLVSPPLNFAAALYTQIKAHLLQWATGPGSFVVVGLTESEDFDEAIKAEVLQTLKKQKKALLEADKAGNKGAKLLLQKL